LDELFCAKVLYSIDFRAQRWLGLCRDAGGDRSTVNDEIVDFSDLTEQVLNGNFDRKLPLIFSTKTQSQTDVSQEDDTPPSKRPKRDGSDKQKKPESIQNPNQCAEFKMREDEDWPLFKIQEQEKSETKTRVE